MMIFDEYKFAVVPIREAASTTIRTELKTVFVRRAFRLGPLHLPPEYEVFAFVRNPVSRAASFWKHQICKDRVHPYFARLGLTAWMPFVEFARVMAKTPDKDLDPHVQSQHLQFPHGTSLYLFERFAEHWLLFRDEIKRLSGETLAEIPAKRNVTGVLVQRTYDEESMALITERYAEDLWMWHRARDWWDEHDKT